MADDTPSTTTSTPLLCPSRRWFSSLSLKTTLSAEFGGFVGDLGTYIPIVLTLTLVNHLDLSTTLIFMALYNISIGFLFGIPMLVQPMKSIAAVAISDPLPSLSQITTVGLSTVATLFIFGATSLMSLLYRFIPPRSRPRRPTLPGPRLRLLRHQIHPLQPGLFRWKIRPPRNWLGLDGFALALFFILFLVLVTGFGDFGDEVIPLGVHEEENDSVNRSCRRVRRRLWIMSSIPTALIVFILGLVLCFIRDPSIVKDLRFGTFRILLRLENWVLPLIFRK
ncbi:hypothetical protein PVL29_013036 [Vitis rotundifolia]|uniref:Molybdate transporter 2 n=1 Tax=Vitis rotundifolia TaxID=103349 RepID=A0AA39DMY6_VITRO|nr:hypothetical protein PVL29_013036 [Vitis rotundifolia]